MDETGDMHCAAEDAKREAMGARRAALEEGKGGGDAYVAIG